MMTAYFFYYFFGVVKAIVHVNLVGVYFEDEAVAETAGCRQIL